MKLLSPATGVLATLALPLPAAAQVDWTPLPPLLPNRQHHAMAFDSGRGCLVVFGGYNEGGSLGDTWEFDGRRWIEVATLPSSPRPAPRRGTTLVYDAARGRCVLFGGERFDGTLVDDTWEWDGTTWLRRSPSTSPPPRFRHACIYDSIRQRVVLHGGRLGRTLLGDTWEWDGTTWTLRVPTSSPGSPGPRMMHAMAFDAARGRTVLFGGNSTLSSTFPAADTWEWDGVAWFQRFPATVPPGRFNHPMAYDALRGRVVMFDGAYAPWGDVWEWDGNDWTQVVPPRATPDPGSRLRHALAWDSTRQRIVMFGGWATVHVNGATSDLWEWDGQAWTVIYEGAPPARNGSGAAYDPDRDRAVLFGGEIGTQGKVGDTWEWDGRAWSLRASQQTSSLARSHHALAFDTVRRRVLMFGGVTPPSRHLGDTWEWDGVAWRRLRPETSPPPRQRHAMATDPARDRIVLFGGAVIDEITGSLLNTFQDTWEWDGTSWLDRAPSFPPPARRDHAMAYDAARSRAVLFGGVDATGAMLADTWEWDGNTWWPVSPLTTPPARRAHAMAYDAARRRVVLFGGMDAAGSSADVWEWDGTDWRMRATASAPRPRSGHVLWFDPVRELTATYGGLSLTRRARYLMSDLWAFGPTYPASVTGFGSGCAGTAGVPLLAPDAGMRPWLGDAFPIVLSNLSPGRAALVVLGRSRAYWSGLTLPLELSPVGMPGCWLLGSPDIVMPVPNPSGTATLVLSIPPAPGLLGLRFVMQGFARDPGANPFGAIASAGLEAVLGGR